MKNIPLHKRLLCPVVAYAVSQNWDAEKEVEFLKEIIGEDVEYRISMVYSGLMVTVYNRLKDANVALAIYGRNPVQSWFSSIMALEI